MPYSSSQLVHVSGKLERRNRLRAQGWSLWSRVWSLGRVKSRILLVFCSSSGSDTSSTHPNPDPPQPKLFPRCFRSAIQRLQKASDRFWVLEHLRRNPGPWEAILIPVYRRNPREGTSLCTMYIPELGLVQSVPPPSIMPLEGHPVRARVVSVSPHRGEVLFKISI